MIIHLSKDCLRRLAITGWPSILMVIVIYCVAFINIPPPPPRIPNYLILFFETHNLSEEILVLLFVKAHYSCLLLFVKPFVNTVSTSIQLNLCLTVLVLWFI